MNVLLSSSLRLDILRRFMDGFLFMNSNCFFLCLNTSAPFEKPPSCGVFRGPPRAGAGRGGACEGSGRAAARGRVVGEARAFRVPGGGAGDSPCLAQNPSPPTRLRRPPPGDWSPGGLGVERRRCVVPRRRPRRDPKAEGGPDNLKPPAFRAGLTAVPRSATHADTEDRPVFSPMSPRPVPPRPVGAPFNRVTVPPLTPGPAGRGAGSLPRGR